MHRNWLVTKTNPEFLQHLAKKSSISTLLAQILVNRGIKDAEAVKNFLNPSLDNLHDPFLLPDMDRAVARLKTAIRRNEKIYILGDYDADGITSTALLVSALSILKLNTEYHIPNRITEGYGISSKGIQKASGSGASLIITVDCGISSQEEVLYARSLGIDVIVTDHHQPPEALPEAAAVIDPHRKDSAYPFRYLAGVGVAFKLVQALFQELKLKNMDAELLELLDLVAIGTIADSVPLLDENRVFISYGLKEINKDACRTGIKALKKAASVAGGMSSVQLSYTIIPRINAAGRLDDASGAVELFLTREDEKAVSMAGVLEGQNRKRQKIEAEVLRSALDMITPGSPENAIILASHDWHPGVIGIVASRLVERFFKPVFLFSIRDSFAKGSARGVPGFHLYNAIAECSGLLLGFGGHRQAAGLKISEDKLDAFRISMNSIAGKNLADADQSPVLQLDATVKFTDLNFSLVKEFSMLEPFGEANREPLLGARNTEIVNHRVVGNKHLKMLLKQDRINFDSIGFSMADLFGKVKNAPSVDIAFVPSINEWNGNRSLQLTVKAMRPGS